MPGRAASYAESPPRGRSKDWPLTTPTLAAPSNGTERSRTDSPSTLRSQTRSSTSSATHSPETPSKNGWWEDSPLSVAVRRRRFQRSDLGPRIASEPTSMKISGPLPRSFELSTPSPSNSSMRRTIRVVSPDRGSSLTAESLEDAGGTGADFEYDEGFSSPVPEVAQEAKVLKPEPLKFKTPERGKSERIEHISTPKVERERDNRQPTTPSPPESIKPAEKDPSPFIFPRVGSVDPRRTLQNSSLFLQRAIMAIMILGINIACLVIALKSQRHLWVLIVILFVKAKDILSTLIQIGWLFFTSIWIREEKEPDMSPKWILACITAYAETEVQTMRTIDSVIDHAPKIHNLAITIILDGKPQNILRHFTKVEQQIRRPYQTWRFAHNEANIYTGNIRNIPVIMIEKIANAGKKDSLILCHDLFNHMRSNVPQATKELRFEIWRMLLPRIIETELPEKFDYLFFTDADSLIHTGTLNRLAAALTAEPKAIGACGLVLVELTPENGWSMWYLYQQFQYTFGQFVRRRAEGIWGRVTCMPGCVTMIKNRPEMAGAVALYAKPITDRVVFQHQVQYLGTDRRITWCMLEQSKSLKTLFVPGATSQTVAPQSFLHYMSQRRRWGSNAFFNDVFYTIGKKSWLITRLWAIIDIVRQALVYYRLANTILFIYGLSRRFDISKLIPYIVVTQTPTVWFLYLAVFHEPVLRKQIHKLVAGWLINKIISPFFSIMIFTRIIWNLGNAVWGRTGASTQPASALDILHNLTPKRSWTPTRITALVKETIRERTNRAAVQSKLAVPLNAAGEPVPAPITHIIEEKQTKSSSYNSPSTPKVAYIPGDDTGSVETVRRYKPVEMSSN